MDGNLRWGQQGRGRGECHVRRIAPSAASDANGHRSTRQHGRGDTAAARLIIRGRLGLDEGRGEGERGAWAWPWLALMMMMLVVFCHDFVVYLPRWAVIDHDVGGRENHRRAAPHLAHEPRRTRPSLFSKDVFSMFRSFCWLCMFERQQAAT